MKQKTDTINGSADILARQWERGRLARIFASLSPAFRRAALILLLAVMTTTTTKAENLTSGIDYCGTSVGCIFLSGWVFDPGAKHWELGNQMTIKIEVGTHPDNQDDNFQGIYDDADEYLERDDINSQYHISGKHGFRARVEGIGPMLFEEETEKTLYVNIYAIANFGNGQEEILLNKQSSTEDRVTLMRQVIGESERSGGDSTRVLQLFHRMLDLPQSDADMALFCATYMNLKKMPKDSIGAVLEKAIQIAPDNAAARLQLVSYAWQNEDRDKVIALCKEARQYNPDEMAFYYYQGIAYYQNSQLDEALDAFQNGIGVITQQSDPAIVSDFYAVMGDIMHQKGMDREAYAAYDSCLQWKDDNIACLNNYAYYLSIKGEQLDKAEQMSYRTIKAEPKNATYLDTYAWILFMQKRYSEARIYIDQTLQNDSDTSAVLLEHAGDIYYHVGDTDKALVFWQQSLDRAVAGNDKEIQGPRRQVLIRKIKLKKYLKE